MTRKTPEYVRGSGDSLKALVSRVGKEKAAELIGCTGSAFSRWLNGGEEPRLAYDLAARYHLSKIDKDKNAAAIAVVVVASAQRESFDHLCQALSLEVKYVVR